MASESGIIFQLLYILFSEHLFLTCIYLKSLQYRVCCCKFWECQSASRGEWS